MENQIVIKRIKEFDEQCLKDLFSSVNWDSAENPGKLKIAFNNSSNVISAWKENKLVGIVRSMDDGCWSANIDCLIVHKNFHGMGIAKLLLSEILDDLKNIKYINVCPDEQDLEQFYSQFGFKIVKGFYLQKVNSL